MFKHFIIVRIFLSSSFKANSLREEGLFENDCLRVFVGAHVRQVLDAGPDVIADGGEVNVGDLLFVAELLHHRRDRRVVSVVDAREEMVFDLK